MALVLFWWLSLLLRRTQQYYALRGRTSRSFLWCWLLRCCCCPRWRFFLFPGFFSLQPTLLLAFSGPWRPPPSLSSTLATFSCFTFARLFCHNFTSHKRFLPYAPWPTFLELFVTQMRAGTPRPGSSSVLDLTEFSLPADSWAWTWTHCSYKTIDLSIAPVSHEV